jgi:3-oxoacyl-[acyl-carrier protein] reductase
MAMMPASSRCALDSGRPQPAAARAPGAAARGTVVLDYLDVRDWRSRCSLKLDHAWIAAHIPAPGRHVPARRGAVLGPAAHRLSQHQPSRADNPLRAHGRLGAACAIEYAAQAVAVHGALLQCPPASGSGFGMLTSARRVEFAVARLDDLAHELLVSAQRLHSDAVSALYSFALHDGERLLAQGRLSLLHGAVASANLSADIGTAGGSRRDGARPGRALVTGGSGGVGAAICQRLAQSGHHVYVHAHRGARAGRSPGAAAQGRRPERRDAVLRRHRRRRHARGDRGMLSAGPIQILVNNAGIHDDAVFPGMSALQWQRVIDVSLQGFFHVTQPLLLPMLRTRWGRILNISSVAALIGNRGQVNYAAAKGALISATRALALEVATRGVTVNAIAPGIIATSMTESSFDDAAIARCRWCRCSAPAPAPKSPA